MHVSIDDDMYKEDIMPYVNIKSFPKDDETKKKIVDQINEIFLKTWGCPQEALSISMEEVAPDDWETKVRKAEILPNRDKMMIFDGKKNY